MPAAWESEAEDERWSDREAWRGDEHQDDCNAWCDDLSEEEEEEEEQEELEDWAADEDESLAEDTPAGWPEDLAGPEYWMFKDFEE